jgi:small subunit ribosomal protein S16
MVVIRLARGGAKNRPFHNIVVADSRHRRDGRFIERVGFYNPMVPQGPEQLRISLDRIGYWKSKGAKASDAVEKLIERGSQAAAAAPAPAA